MINFRAIPKNENSIITDFDFDRDKILHSKEFRRLNGKTQVFVAGFDDHVRNRLTHTIEVSQIARTISKNLELNQTLTDAIAMGHDVGHTPFGHVGERTLNYIMNGCDVFYDYKIHGVKTKGFKHNWQGVRVVTDLEKISNNYNGLNLTNYTIWGILNHSSLKYKPCDFLTSTKTCSFRHQNKDCTNLSEEKELEVADFELGFYNNAYNKKINDKFNEDSWTVEALVVRIADEIAQRHHDLEDGIRANIIDIEELIEQIKKNFNQHLTSSEKGFFTKLSKEKNKNIFIYSLSRMIISIYINNIITQTKINLTSIKTEYKIKNEVDYENNKKEIFFKKDVFQIVNFNSEFKKSDKSFQRFLSRRIINSHLAQTMDGKSNYLIRRIYQAFLTNPAQLPDATIITFFINYLSDKDFEKIKSKYISRASIAGLLRVELKSLQNEHNNKKYSNVLLRTLTDYIAGMTDQYALNQYNMLYGVKTLKNYN